MELVTRMWRLGVPGEKQTLQEHRHKGIDPGQGIAWKQDPKAPNHNLRVTLTQPQHCVSHWDKTSKVLSFLKLVHSTKRGFLRRGGIYKKRIRKIQAHCSVTYCMAQSHLAWVGPGNLTGAMKEGRKGTYSPAGMRWVVCFNGNTNNYSSNTEPQFTLNI